MGHINSEAIMANYDNFVQMIFWDSWLSVAGLGVVGAALAAAVAIVLSMTFEGWNYWAARTSLVLPWVRPFSNISSTQSDLIISGALLAVLWFGWSIV